MYMMNLEKLGSQNMCGLIDFVRNLFVCLFVFPLRAKGNQWRLKQEGGDGMGFKDFFVDYKTYLEIGEVMWVDKFKPFRVFRYNDVVELEQSGRIWCIEKVNLISVGYGRRGEIKG